MTRIVIFSLAAALVVALVPADEARAQTGTLTDGKAVKLVNLDLTVPDSPALVILGLSPDKVVRPSAPKDLATTLLNGVDRRGNLQNGVAVDFSPRFLFAGNSLAYADYRDNRVTRLLANIQVSLATAKGATDGDKSMRVAFGVRSTLWDKGDPRLDEELVKCLDAIAIPVPAHPLLGEEAQRAWEEEQTKALRPKALACQSASAKRLWNASSLAIGVAPAYQSPTGLAADLQYSGAALWTALALRLPGKSHFGQLMVQGHYRNRELIPDASQKGVFFEQDSAGVGLRLLLGEPVRALIIESELGRKSPKSGDPSTAFTVSAGGQLKLSDELWLSAAIGGALKDATGQQRGLFVLSSFKWALSKEPSVKAP
jgi:hypothetical protein